MNELLNARDQRQVHIEKLLIDYPMVISIKSNIPGINKSMSEAYLLVRLFFAEIKKTVDLEHIDFFDSFDGPYYLCALHSYEIDVIKQKLIDIEENHSLGRLIDLDLFHHELYGSIRRTTLGAKTRKCFICGNDAFICARNQTHSEKELIDHIKQTITSYLEKTIHEAILYAMIRELELEHKFGLVEKNTSGSHDDMHYELMKKAMETILPYFDHIWKIGFESNALETLLESSRPIGVMAEKDMLDATGGVHCYKGLIFVLGLFLLSVGYAIGHNQPFFDIFENIKIIAKDVINDFKKTPTTNGLKQFRLHRFKGVRGEAYQGFSSIKVLMNHFNDQDDDLRESLKNLILMTEDSVFLSRAQTYERYQMFREIIQKTDVKDIEQAKSLTKLMTDEHISFGGSADLLIALIFMDKIRHLFD